MIRAGSLRDGIGQLHTGLAGMHRAGAHLRDTQWLGLIAKAHLRAGQKDAKALLDELD